jgi:hypothetical protein
LREDRDDALPHQNRVCCLMPEDYEWSVEMLYVVCGGGGGGGGNIYEAIPIYSVIEIESM